MYSANQQKEYKVQSDAKKASTILWTGVSVLAASTLFLYWVSKKAKRSTIIQKETVVNEVQEPKKMSKIGGMKQQQQISEGDEAYKVALAVKNQLEQRTGKIYDFYNPVAVSTQVVAGINYFLKIDVGNEHIHVRVYKDLQQNLTVHSYQSGKTSSDPLTYF